MAKDLKVTSTDATGGEIIVNMSDARGRDYVLRLSAADVSILVSGMYAARAEALGQDLKRKPEQAIMVNGLDFSTDDEREYMRIFVTEQHHIDFAAAKSSPFALAIEALSRLVEQAMQATIASRTKPLDS